MHERQAGGGEAETERLGSMIMQPIVLRVPRCCSRFAHQFHSLLELPADGLQYCSVSKTAIRLEIFGQHISHSRAI